MSRALLLVDHGSRKPEAARSLETLARAIAEARPDWLVESAHMELAEPDFQTGVERLVERGARRIHVHLHFLSDGMHVRETIPALVAQARERHPAIEFEVGEPLGHDPGLVDLILSRYERAPEAPRQRSKA